jgi:hypothetical protein
MCGKNWDCFKVKSKRFASDVIGTMVNLGYEGGAVDSFKAISQGLLGDVIVIMDYLDLVGGTVSYVKLLSRIYSMQELLSH